MSLYIRLMTGFWKNRKTMRLRSKIGNDAYWIPPRLWSYAAENQPDGDFSTYSAEELAMLLEYASNPQALLEALIDSSFLDADQKLHGWDEHNGYHQVFAERAAKAASARWGKKTPPDPLKKQKEKGHRKEKSKHRVSIASSIPDSLSSLSGFYEAWEGFEDGRIAKKSPMTEFAAALILKTLADHPEKAIAALQVAAVRNWTGFEWEWYDKHTGANGSNGHKSNPKNDTDLHSRKSEYGI